MAICCGSSSAGKTIAYARWRCQDSDTAGLANVHKDSSKWQPENFNLCLVECARSTELCFHLAITLCVLHMTPVTNKQVTVTISTVQVPFILVFHSQARWLTCSPAHLSELDKSVHGCINTCMCVHVYMCVCVCVCVCVYGGGGGGREKSYWQHEFNKR